MTERDRQRERERERGAEKVTETERDRDENIILEGIGYFVDICFEQFFETIIL